MTQEPQEAENKTPAEMAREHEMETLRQLNAQRDVRILAMRLDVPSNIVILSDRGTYYGTYKRVE